MPLSGVTAVVLAVAHDRRMGVHDKGLVELNQVPLIGYALMALQEQADAELAVAHDGTRMQPVFALLERLLLPSPERFLVADGRKIDQWYAQHRLALADISDQPNAYTNVNTPENLAQMSQMLGLSRTRREAPDPWSP